MPKELQLKSNSSKIQPSRWRTSSLCFLSYVLGLNFIFLGGVGVAEGWRARLLAGSQFSNQKLNHGHGSERPESQPLGHQETPGTFILNKTKISAICKISKRSNQTSETVRCKRIPQEPESWPCKPGTQLPLKPSLLLQLQKNSPGSQKSTKHYYFSWSIIALQRCVSFCSIAEWTRCMFTDALLSLLRLPPTPLGYHGTEPSSLCYIAASHWHLIQHDSVYMSLLPSQFTPPSPSTSPFSRSVSLFLPWI